MRRHGRSQCASCCQQDRAKDFYFDHLSTLSFLYVRWTSISFILFPAWRQNSDVQRFAPATGLMTTSQPFSRTLT
jgi:hypothetical protein